jgi:DNA-binding MarR family transcriptional regulator
MPRMARAGFELPLLLAAAFRALVDELNLELAARGHPDVRPVHGFALQAVSRGSATTSELGRRLGISKQAAAKTVAGLEALGYVERASDADDRRSRRLALTPHGVDCLRTSAEILERLHERWAGELGSERISALEDALEAIAGGAGGTRLGDLPGWLRG